MEESDIAAAADRLEMAAEEPQYADIRADILLLLKEVERLWSVEEEGYQIGLERDLLS